LHGEDAIKRFGKRREEQHVAASSTADMQIPPCSIEAEGMLAGTPAGYSVLEEKEMK